MLLQIKELLSHIFQMSEIEAFSLHDCVHDND